MRKFALPILCLFYVKFLPDSAAIYRVRWQPYDTVGVFGRGSRFRKENIIVIVPDDLLGKREPGG